MTREGNPLPSASVPESVQLNQLLIIPNAVQGIFRRRPKPVGLATRLDVDRRAVRFMEGLARKYAPGPLWINVMTDRVLLVLAPEDVRYVLEGSPHPFAADPAPKRKGMGTFQPFALTLSRGELWENRRRFTEAVLGKADRARVRSVAEEEVAALLDELGDATLDYDALHRAFRRLTRRIVLGDSARDDEPVSDMLAELMAEANALPGKPSQRLDPFMERIAEYVAKAEQGSLVGEFGDAPADPDTRVEGQVPHWLFATQDTLAANVLRALAALATQRDARERAREDEAYMTACLQEAMRLWPTTPLLSRETLVQLTWRGDVVPAGTQVLISNLFFHRSRDRLPYADRFAPEEWLEGGSAAGDWAINHFSHGPQGCPGHDLALFIGTVVLAALVNGREPLLAEPKLDPERPLPTMLDAFKVRVGLGAAARAGSLRAGA